MIGYGFTISPCNSSYVLSMYDLSDNNDISYEAKSNASFYATWDLKLYTGGEAKGYELLSNSHPFVVGETATFRAAVWSTEAGCNYPTLSIKSEDYSKISFEWDEEDRSAAVEFLNPGQITISCKIYDQNMNEYYGWSNRHDIQQIRDGIYFIKNGALNKYIQIDNDATSYYSSGNTIEACNFNGGKYQKWNIIYVGSGYYKIISVKSDLALTVPSNHVNSAGQLIQDNYITSDRQLWKITKSSSGRYILIPKTNETYNFDWCVSTVAQSSESTDSFSVQQRTYVNDQTYRDEWILVGMYDSTFIAIPEGEGHPHDASFEYVKSALNCMGYISNRTESELTATECLTYLSSSKIFYSRSHGDKKSIKLNDEDLTISMIDELAADALIDCDLVLYGACRTGEGEEQGNNLVNKTHAKGAKTVIGFTESVNCSEVNAWAEVFFNALANGSTIESACNAADEFIHYNWDKPITTNSNYIAGLKTQTLN